MILKCFTIILRIIYLVASHTDDDLKYPEECSNDDDEDGMGTDVLLFSNCFSHYYDVPW